jgi:hypothetical protein
MVFRLLALFAGLLIFLAPVARAQDANAVPQGVDALAAHATLATNFTFNKTMLDAMSQTLPDDERRIVAQLNSITVHNFRYSGPGMYDPATLDAVRAQYAQQGWNHLVTKQAHAAAQPAAPQGGTSAPVAAPMPAAPRDPARTDLYVRMAHANVEGIVVLVANQRNVTLVTVDGTISPLDLLHLRGHFGIPRFSGDDVEDAK